MWKSDISTKVDLGRFWIDTKITWNQRIGWLEGRMAVKNTWSQTIWPVRLWMRIEDSRKLREIICSHSPNSQGSFEIQTSPPKIQGKRKFLPFRFYVKSVMMNSKGQKLGFFDKNGNFDILGLLSLRFYVKSNVLK